MTNASAYTRNPALRCTWLEDGMDLAQLVVGVIVMTAIAALIGALLFWIIFRSHNGHHSGIRSS